MKKYCFMLLLFLSFSLLAQPPAGYYSSAQGKSGENLRDELQLIIDGHSEQTYNSLWTHFEATDNKGGSEVWDIYSDNPSGSPAYTFTFGTDQCGNYGGEGDCFNREHSVPGSWFNDQAPMYTDLFMVYPTDGYVNGMRSSLPYGETNNASWTSTNGSKKGSSSISGYTGTIFEPIDEYKGDLARTYFYMITRYKDEVSNWSSPMFSGDNMTTWAVNMMINWSNQDTVSQKEIARNDSIYQVQGNRNPYIDHPEWVEEVWLNINSIQKDHQFQGEVVYRNNQLQLGHLKNRSFSLEVYNPTGKEILTLPRKNRGDEFKKKLNVETGVYLIRLQFDKFEACEKLMIMD